MGDERLHSLFDAIRDGLSHGDFSLDDLRDWITSKCAVRWSKSHIPDADQPSPRKGKIVQGRF
jgi:hypothetical protein